MCVCVCVCVCGYTEKDLSFTCLAIVLFSGLLYVGWNVKLKATSTCVCTATQVCKGHQYLHVGGVAGGVATWGDQLPRGHGPLDGKSG